MLDVEIRGVELDGTILFLWRKFPYPYAEIFSIEMMAMRATTPAGFRKKVVFMVTADRNAQVSLCVFFCEMKG